jgi:hypothetical protein
MNHESERRIIANYRGDFGSSTGITQTDARARNKINHAQHPPALNLHLTKTRLNDALCLCEIFAGTFLTVANRAQVSHSNVPPSRSQSDAAWKGNKVDLVWMQGE